MGTGLNEWWEGINTGIVGREEGLPGKGKAKWLGKFLQWDIKSGHLHFYAYLTLGSYGTMSTLISLCEPQF